MLLEKTAPLLPAESVDNTKTAFTAALESQNTLHSQSMPFRTRFENLMLANSVMPIEDANYRDFYVLKNERILVNAMLPDLAIHPATAFLNSLETFRATHPTDTAVNQAITGIGAHMDNLLSTTPKIRINAARRRSSATDNPRPNLIGTPAFAIDNVQSAPYGTESRRAFFRIHPLIHQDIEGIQQKTEELRTYAETIRSANLNRIEGHPVDTPRPAGASSLATLALLKIAEQNPEDLNAVRAHPDYEGTGAERLVQRSIDPLDQTALSAIRNGTEPNRKALDTILDSMESSTQEDTLLDFVSKVDFYREAFRNGFPYF